MTHPTQEDDVKALKAALALGPDSAFYTHWRDSNKSQQNEVFALACNPERIARLLARLEQAERRHSDLVAVLVPVVEIIRNLDDNGPRGEGWQSWQLETGIRAIDAHIAAIASEVKT